VYSYCSGDEFERGMNAGKMVVDIANETRRGMHYQAPKYALAPLPRSPLVRARTKWALTLGEVQSGCVLTRDVSVDQISHGAHSRECALQN